jgi:serine/threonine protein phosphatase PrpC
MATIFVVCGELLSIAAVGDRWAYLWRSGTSRLALLREDDTVMGDAVLHGVPRDQAARLPRAHA